MIRSSRRTLSCSAQRGHPKGLYFLFFTEMWERFSYYGMKALLVYYMMKHLLLGQEQASHIYGLYTGFVYFTPFFGGLLADRILGQRRTVIVGAVLMAIGHFLMALEPMFFVALLFLILGNGAFKPNISTQVGALYLPGDHRRDRAFSIFYMGINLGAFFSPLVCGTLGEVYGWHYGFSAAGVGMLAGLAIYLIGQKHLAPDYIGKRSPDCVPRHEALGRDDKSKILGLVALMVFAIIFWGVYEQQGNTLALWADMNTDRVICGWEMPASWFQAFNPAMIILLTPAITGFWSWQSRRGREPSSVAKMAIGCMLLGGSFVVMICAAQVSTQQKSVSLWWLFSCMLILTVGELYLSPVGLSLVTKLAPARMVSMLMGMWFLSSFAGNYMAGYLGTFWEKMPKADFFLILSLLAFGAGLGMFAVLRPLKRAIGHELGKEPDV
ncbi:MAG: peptide MFS transporter [Syntrophales bacterium LBB04]|nr:peptide MFS transporter [Syntrophales bacterium LBB04]